MYINKGLVSKQGVQVTGSTDSWFYWGPQANDDNSLFFTQSTTIDQDTVAKWTDEPAVQDDPIKQSDDAWSKWDKQYAYDRMVFDTSYCWGSHIGDIDAGVAPTPVNGWVDADKNAIANMYNSAWYSGVEIPDGATESDYTTWS